MKKITLTSLVIVMYTTLTFSQNLTQTVRGTINDADNKMPLIGANIIIIGTNPLIGVATDVNGRFRLENVPIGRINLKLSYLGYEAKYVSDIVVNSGKEVVLDLAMQESAVRMNEVVVTANKNKGEAINDMALISARSVSNEETSRYTGGMGDPSRVVSNFAGVACTPDGSSDIIVRGNAPKYMQWRLDGIEITSPYHFDDQNASFGALTALNNNLLATSDFYSGAFSPEYGDVLSSVFDVKLRNGNNEKFEAAAGVGIMGTDITLEGPFKKGYGGSYLINYRYSTVSLIKDLGLVNVDGILNYQDATFKVLLPSKNAGTFSFFGLGGLSGFSMKNMKTTDLDTPGRIRNADIRRDYDKGANLANLGMNHIMNINKSSFISSSLSYSANGFTDDVEEAKSLHLNGNTGESQGDSLTEKIPTFKSRIVNSAYRGAITYNNKFSQKNRIKIGTKYTLSVYDFNQSMLNPKAGAMVLVTDFKQNVSTISNFISWKHSFNEKVTLIAGLHNMNVLLNNKSTLEPRIAINWKLNRTTSIHLGYGNHSQMEKIQNYFTLTVQPDGSVTEPNKNLGLLKAHHFVAGYEKHFSDHLVAKAEVYFQDLYNLPVEDNDTSYYATINEGIDYRYVPLVNKGAGKNYGVEITLERFFDKNFYFLINTSLFESKYKSLEGVWRNTQYNGNYLGNILCGKEFKSLGKKRNQTMAINAKVFFGGGKKYIPLLRDANGNVDVDTANNRYFDYKKAFAKSIDDVYQVNLSVSYKFNKQKATHEIFLDLMNLTDNKPRMSEYYDAGKPGKIGYRIGFGFFPNIMYRVYF